jgi:cobalt-zinc-cadmium efflux system membrane fusion protein
MQPTNEVHSDVRPRLLHVGLAVMLLMSALATMTGCSRGATSAGSESAESEHHDEVNRGMVELSPESIKAAGIEIVQVTERPVVNALRATGTIEANQQRMQEVTPLVSGRVEKVFAVAGSQVREGTILALLSSPEVAELHGKELEARSRVELATSSLRRLQRLSELGAAAGKDLAAAESEAETANAELQHIRGSLDALGSDERGNGHSISTVAIRAPISGTVTARHVNAGAGVQAGTPVFVLADLSTVWVIANVPESQINMLHVGTVARVRSSALVETIAQGRVTYVDPILNEETRTARVRVEVENPMQKLRIGTFVETDFESAGSATTATELVVPETAVQTLESKQFVFIPTEKPGHFEVREIQAGAQSEGLRKVTSGLTARDRVVARGSFVLKTQMLKGEMGEEH